MTKDFSRTLVRVAYSIVIAIVAGVPVGIVLGAKAAIYRSVEFIVDFFRSTPATALFPLFLLLFGLGDLAKIAVAAFAAWLVIVFNVAYGVMNARQTRILAARSMGASSLRIFRDVIFFETLPQTFVGLRTAVSLALVVIIVAEMFIGATDWHGTSHHRRANLRLADRHVWLRSWWRARWDTASTSCCSFSNARSSTGRANSCHSCHSSLRGTCDVKIGSARCRHRGRSVRRRQPPAHAACDKMDKVTAAWLPIMQTTAYYVAIEEKLFEKACIEIDSNKMESPNQIIDALIAERADFGPPGAAAGIAMIAESKFPGKLKIFGLQGGGIAVNRINDGLIVKPDSPIKVFADLKGKTLGHVPGIQWRTISRHMVRAAGLDPDKDVKLDRSGGRDAGAGGRRRDG